jgi:LacI family transcriptional regulator
MVPGKRGWRPLNWIGVSMLNSVKSESRPPRVKDVAELAGVSVSTVSNVLNIPGRVAVTTRQKVESAMADLGFVRNESARHLRAGRSRTVAFVASDAANPFFSEIAAGAQEVVEQQDLSLFLCNSQQDVQRQTAYLGRLEQQRVLGVLITPVADPDILIDSLPERGTPVVVLDDRTPKGRHCSVSVDDHYGGRLAGEHLAERGHSRIAFVGPEGVRQVDERRAGFLAMLPAHGAVSSDHFDITADGLTVKDGRRAAERIVAMPAEDRPTAAFCANDLLAIGLIQGLTEAGLAIPDDLAVVGYDDIEFAQSAIVPLTSIASPARELGRAAARLLLEESANPGHQHQQITFTPHLVTRKSST